MWFIGVEVEQETSAPPPKKKILDPPLKCFLFPFQSTFIPCNLFDVLNNYRVLK